MAEEKKPTKTQILEGGVPFQETIRLRKQGKGKPDLQKTSNEVVKKPQKG